jgi:peptide/nickel transport system permease protein
MRWLVSRLLWSLLMLLAITLLTFVVVDSAPVDRAELEVEKIAAERGFAAGEREELLLQLRVRYGLLDPATRQPVPLWRRYGAWLRHAATLRFGGPGQDHAALSARLWQALPVTLWIGGLALAMALVGGALLGAWSGLHPGSPRDRLVSTVLLALAGVPEFLMATLLVLAFGVSLPWLPISGLHSPGAERWDLVPRLLDVAWHLVLPVAVTAIGPTMYVARFVRDAVARAAGAPFAVSLRALGMDAAVVRRRLLRHGVVPMATLAGELLPMLVAGSIVVENAFALDGLGHLAFQAVMGKELPLLLALLVLGSTVTLFSLLLSDLLHRWIDPRVRLR